MNAVLDNDMRQIYGKKHTFLSADFADDTDYLLAGNGVDIPSVTGRIPPKVRRQLLQLYWKGECLVFSL